MKQPYAYLNTPIIFNPYQYKPYMYYETSKSNILIGDEVGLGKTIEAGIIISQILYEKANPKVLVICPAFLRDKWKDELLEKFYVHSEIFSKQRSTTEKVVVLPVSKLKSFIDNQYLGINHFDLIVVDEVHYYKNTGSNRYKYLEKITNKFSTSRLIFMSATPINNKESDYDNVYRLLGTGVQTTNTTKKEAYINIKSRKIHDIFVELSEEEMLVYSETDKLPPFEGTIYRHIGASCLNALVRYTENKKDHSKEIAWFNEELCLDNEIETDSSFISDFSIKGRLPFRDTKIECLFNTLSKHSSEKIVIFSHYIETVKYLYDGVLSYLRKHGRNSNHVAYYYANNPSDNIPRNHKKNRFLDVQQWFCGDEFPKIMICSDSCKEGVDLQSASVLVNYDLPFNPSIVEQRIGRIDRLGQKKNMTIYNFHVEDTYDDRLNMILNTKLRIIFDMSLHKVGNPLNISADTSDTITSKFIKYFKQHRLTNEDISIIRKMLKAVGIKTDSRIDVNELKSLLSLYSNQIISWMKNPKSEPIEDEYLYNLKEQLCKQLDFEPFSDYVDVKVNLKVKQHIITKCKLEPDYFNKVQAVFVNFEKIENYAIEYGEYYEITEADIKDELKIDFLKPSIDTFVPKDILKEWSVIS